MKTIVVPIDFSPLSQKAIDFAVGIAAQIEAGLTLVHSYAIPHTGSNFSSSLTTMLRNNAEEAMDKCQNAIPTSIPVQSMVTPFPLKEALQKLSKDKKNIWVVMATKGEQDWLDHQLGTNASNVVNAIHVPVFLLPESSEVTFPLKSAVFATDGEDMDDYVKTEWQDIQFRLGLSAQAIELVEDPKQQGTCEYENMVLHKVYHKNLILGLQEIKEVLDADLTVAVHHKRNIIQTLFHSSATKQLALTHKNPLLVLHE